MMVKKAQLDKVFELEFQDNGNSGRNSQGAVSLAVSLYFTDCIEWID